MIVDMERVILEFSYLLSVSTVVESVDTYIHIREKHLYKFVVSSCSKYT